MKKKDLDRNYMNTREFLGVLTELLRDHKEPCPKFTKREVLFLTELLLYKDNDLILFSIADFLADNYNEGVPVFANGASYRRLEFFRNFFSTRGNATKSAILSGYSPKSAKQQGYRLIRWIRRAQYDSSKSLSGFSGE